MATEVNKEVCVYCGAEMPAEKACGDLKRCPVCRRYEPVKGTALGFDKDGNRKGEVK